MTKRIFCFLLVAVMLLGLLSGCADVSISSAKDAPDASNSVTITLEGDKIRCKGGGVSVSGSTATVSASGNYIITGSLNAGKIVVNTGDDAGIVHIVLDNASITNPNGPAIEILQAKDLRIQLNAGSTNRLCSGTEGQLMSEDDSSGAVIFSEDDLDIEGEGALEILGYINNGITCKDDLDINGGVINILAVNNGIKGSESVDIKGGHITVKAGNDGIKSSSATKAGKGYVTVIAGDIDITSAGDGIAAETELSIEGGSISVLTEGDNAVTSCKALKGKTGLTINGGSISLNSSDHSIHSAAGLSINGGTINIVCKSGKGIAAHDDMFLSGGTVTVSAWDDGIETEGCITVSGGSFNISSGSNGIKAGFTGTGFETDNGLITVNGGDIVINAMGDAIDGKGPVTVNGGSVFALGYSKSLKSFDSGSTQGFIGVSFKGAAGDEVSVDELAKLSAIWDFNTVLFSSPQLKPGTEYSVSTGINSISAVA